MAFSTGDHVHVAALGKGIVRASSMDAAADACEAPSTRG